jgi:hypothetical protein
MSHSDTIPNIEYPFVLRRASQKPVSKGGRQGFRRFP